MDITEFHFSLYSLRMFQVKHNKLYFSFSLALKLRININLAYFRTPCT